MAKMSQQDLARMSKGLRHLLRNHASGIKAATTLLAGELDSRCTPAEKEYFPLIIRECDKLADTASRLTMLLEGIPRGETKRIEHVIEIAVRTSRNQFPTAIIERNQRDSLDHICVTDDQGLLFSLRELIANGVEAAPGKPVTVECEMLDDHVSIRVSDCGPGIADANWMSFAGPFVTTKPSRLGIGLSIALSAISKMDGLIRPCSSSGKSAVEIVLPKSNRKMDCADGISYGAVPGNRQKTNNTVK